MCETLLLPPAFREPELIYRTRYASKRLKAERDVALAAIMKDVHALRYVSTELYADRDVMCAGLLCTYCDGRLV